MYKGLLLEVQRGLWDLKLEKNYLERCHCQKFSWLNGQSNTLYGTFYRKDAIYSIWDFCSINDYEREPGKVQRGFRDPHFKYIYVCGM